MVHRRRLAASSLMLHGCRGHHRLFTWTAGLLQRVRPGPLSPAARRAAFGSYDLILPPPQSLSASVLSAPRLPIPASIPHPEYDRNTGHPLVNLDRPHIKDSAEIAGMRDACALARRMLDYAAGLVGIGVRTDEIDRLVHERIVAAGAYPSPLGYMGYPKSICTSINNVICHGRPLQDGDIVNIDITVYLNGFHGDNSATFLVGNVDEKGQRLVSVTRDALDAAIAVCAPLVAFNEIGRVVSEHASKAGLSSCPDFSGHGIGRQFHEPPMIYHFRNTAPGIMLPGMVFTIEPMLCQGAAGHVRWPDNWTAVTKDGGRSAQFEHTILITPEGSEILTA
ncbi:Methionine aminopeptidase 1D, chloroplastic/mitochondrial [Geranomyces variabilis]|uniref:Methionine aminopeptidase n=1 Tax=Geranomyces variabilis TaxID=109894 RepID=A0AAD5XN81_9FUNG|nr:Methionine aminopeptidase 1D, chloroplastic/mitochondrial [Geranomyces variabilis]